jgi:TetR/AcrR family transcriptional regulator
MSNTTNNPESDGPTKNRILQAAKREFARFGLAGARVDRIAASAGVNKAMIYYHFSSKEKLYHAVFDYHFQQIATMLKERLAVPASAEGRLEAAAEFYTYMFTLMEDFRALMLRELAEPSGELLDPMAERIRESGIPQIIVNTLSDEINEGRFRDVDLRQAIASFLAMNIGYFFLEPMITRVLKISDRDQFVQERTQAIVDLFLNGMKVSQT